MTISRKLAEVRGCRRKGFGTTAFHLLLEELETDTIDTEVLSWNEAGIGFWRSLGFKERSICMRYNKKTPREF